MKTRTKEIITRASIGIFAAAFLVVSFGSASVVGPLPPVSRNLSVSMNATATLRDMARLGILQNASQSTLEDMLNFQAHSGQSLAQILRNPLWIERLGLKSDTFKATWYAANPYDLLPADLKQAIRKTTTPFTTRQQINQWCKKNKAPERWVKALNSALIETTPVNLWRASRGKRPYAKNGQFLEPIVVETAKGQFDVRDGHIAVDPKIIPMNTKLLLLVRINGQDRVLRVKAADIGEAIRGRHVDLPITIKSTPLDKNHNIRFPGEYIRNPKVILLMPGKKANPGRKA